MSLGVGNVFLNQKNASGGGISGTGTTNYLPLWTGATALGDSYVYQTAGYVNIPVKLSLASSATYSSGNAILEDINWTLNVPASTTFPQSVIDSISNVFTMNFAGAATIPNTARNTAFNSIINTGFVGGSVVSYNQSTGVRALSTFQSYFQVTNGFTSIISHAANIQIKCDEIFGATGITYTNRYGLLINDLNETASALITYTNRWGIYQEGASDLNYFAGNVLIGSTTNQGAYKLQVTGKIYVGNSSGSINNAQLVGGTNQAILFRDSPSDIAFYNGSANPSWAMSGAALMGYNVSLITWNATANGAYGGGPDTGIGRNGVGVLEINSGTLAAYRDLKLRGSFFTGRNQEAKGANVASAGDLTLGSDGNAFLITGTTTINAITTTNWQAGSVIRLIFAASLTVSNNVAGGANTAKILLNGSVNFAATLNDVLTLVYDGTNWLEASRSLN